MSDKFIFKVRITKFPSTGLWYGFLGIKVWYRNLIGKEFDVFERDKKTYEVLYFGNGIAKEDCEIVSDESK